MRDVTEPLSRLAALADDVDRHFEAIRNRCGSCMDCGPGCSDCCRARLSITHVEAVRMRQGLTQLPESKRRELSVRAQDPQREMCPALDPDGRCAVYEHRPLICRSYGVPLRRRRPVSMVNPPQLEVCDRNFKGMALRTLPSSDVVDQTELEASLDAINLVHCEAEGHATDERVPIAQILI